MGISVQSRKMLWGRSGNQCSFEACTVELAHEHDPDANAVVIGEEAHIVAQKPDGPRGASPLTRDQRDHYSNLILLCPTHHSLVDSDEAMFPVAKLLEMKAVHEASVRPSRDGADARAEEQWAQIVDGVTSRLDLGNWDNNFSRFCSGRVVLRASFVSDARETIAWIGRRPWPAGNAKVQNICGEIAHAFNDLLNKFDEHSVVVPRECLEFEAYYKQRWDPENYDRLLKEYLHDLALMEDLALELTRLANWFADEVRRTIDSDYRFEEGYCTLTSALGFGLETRIPKYREDERSQDHPYSNMANFLRVRHARDLTARPN